jgi:hypothetical protein
MRYLSLCFAVAWGAVTSASAAPVDYSKIDRTVVKAPAFQTRAPLYILLLFGPSAKLRVWVVLDGERVYVDRNGDGDLTGKDERFESLAACRNIEIADPDGKTRYVITGFSTLAMRKGAERRGLIVEIDVQGPLRYQQYGGGR